MMPWFFSYDRMNYSRYLPVYWLEMVELRTSHPWCCAQITEREEWTVQRQSKHGFASIACDLAIEQTCNRDSKVQDGLKGITGNRGAIHRWIMSQHERAAITRQCEVMAGLTGQTRQRKDLDKSRTIRDEEAVENIISTCESMVNPFDTLQTELVSLSSGATSEVKEDLLSAERMGEKALMAYMEEKLISPTGDMFRPIKRLNLKTFSEQSKRQSRSQADKTIVSNDKKLFARLLVIGQSRKMDLREILSFSLAPVSQPLANDEGSFTKSNKAALLHILETKSENSLVDCVPSRGALIIDANSSACTKV